MMFPGKVSLNPKPPMGYGNPFGCRYCGNKQVFKIEDVKICGKCLANRCIGIRLSKNGKHLETFICTFQVKQERLED